jgi:hypothetical protein
MHWEDFNERVLARVKVIPASAGWKVITPIVSDVLPITESYAMEIVAWTIEVCPRKGPPGQ